MKKRISCWLLILMMASMLAFTGCKDSGKPDDGGITPVESESDIIIDDDDKKEIMDKIELIDGIIDEYFMDPNGLNVSKKELIEGIYAETYKYYQQSLEGTYRGIGILVNTNSPDGKAYINKVYKGGTAEAVGIKEGDQIYEVDGTLVTTDNVYEVIYHIRSTEGVVHFKVYRPDTKEYIEFEPETTDVELPSVYWEPVEDGIGYIGIENFSYNTVSQFKEAYDELKSQGMTKLIIDLRDNGGGLVSACCDILDMFISDGIFMTATDKRGNAREYSASSGSDDETKIAILMNGNSASASEIFAGAMQDHGRAKLIGTQSFGKGIIQVTIELGDGSAMKITYSEYSTPSGKKIHGVGITPDIVVEPGDDEEKDDQLDAAKKYLNE